MTGLRAYVRKNGFRSVLIVNTILVGTTIFVDGGQTALAPMP